MTESRKLLSVDDYISTYEDMLNEEAQGTTDEMVAHEPEAFPTYERGAIARYPQTMRSGSSGNTVRFLQKRLNVSVDGKFGPETERATRAFQEVFKLAVDGIVGPKTWSDLLDEPLYYMQSDPRWNHYRYTSTGNASQTVGNSGCGPTSMTCVINSLQQRVITPPKACDYAVATGYRTANSGTSWGFFPSIAAHFDLNCVTTNSVTDVVDALDEPGVLAVANMGPGYFTKSGHYIVLWAADPYSKIIYALDPASRNRVQAPISTYQREGKKFFIVSAK